MDFRLDQLIDHLPFLLDGAKVTILITVTAMAMALVVGLIAALMRLTHSKLVAAPAAFYVIFFNSTPPLVHIVWFFFVLPIFIGRDIPGFWAGVIAFGLYIGAYLSEIFRGGIRGISEGQWQAAESLGMSYAQAMRRIILPQAVVRMLPPIGNMFLSLFKISALVSAIGVPDLLRQGLTLSALTFQPVETLTVVAAIYGVMTYLQTLWINALHRRFLVHES